MPSLQTSPGVPSNLLREVHLPGERTRPVRVEDYGGEGLAIPLFMDVHKHVPGATLKDVADAHMKDLETQGRYGVKYLKYFFDETAGSIFCLVEAPNKEAAERVHREAHGLLADEIHEVIERS